MSHKLQENVAPDISIVIVNWNSYEEIRACLKSLLEKRSRLISEIIVIDNFSSDGSAEKIPAEFPSVQFIANSKNLGFAEGCNRPAI